MGCVDELCAGLADLARPVHVGTVLVRVRPRPLKTQFYRRPAVQWSRRAYAGALKRRYDDLKKMRKWKIGILFPAGIRRPCGSPPCQSHIATSLGPHTSSGGLGAGSDQFGVSCTTTRTRLGRSRSSSTLRTTFSRPGLPSRTAPRRATATSGPRTRRGVIWAAPTTAALTVAIADSSATEAP